MYLRKGEKMQRVFRSWKVTALIYFILFLFPIHLFAGEEGKVTDLTLDNGLKVLLKEVHASPVVSVWCWYKVGSKNESPGITGISHWVEHMNFKGTKEFSKGDIWNLLERAGGFESGYTWLDLTTYLETLPKDKLDLGLRMEKERMTSSLFDSSEVASERGVIISELQGGENDPETILDEKLWGVAFEAHPYRFPTIGYLSDLEKITRDDLYNYYKSHYMPNNATLVVVGDFEIDKIIPHIKELFENIPPGKTPEPLRTVEPFQEGEKRFILKGGGDTRHMEIGYKIPETFNHDFYPLLILDAILTGAKGANTNAADYWSQVSKSSRLYKALVDEKLATEVRGILIPFANPNLYTINLILSEDKGFKEVEERLYKEIDRLKTELVPEPEFDKAFNQLKAKLSYEDESVTEQAHQLGYYETISSYKLYYTLLDSLNQVKREDIKRVAEKYLNEDQRTVGWYIPAEGEKALSSENSGSSSKSYYKSYSSEKINSQPEIEVETPASPSPLQAKREVLKNGMVVLIKENHSTSSVNLIFNIRAGSFFDPNKKHGLADFTASMLDRGTDNLSKDKIAEKIDFTGAELNINTSVQTVNISARSLSSDYKKILALLGDMLIDPSFPEEEMEKVRKEILSSIDENLNNTGSVAEDNLHRLLYPEQNPFHWPVLGEKDQVISLSRQDLENFHNRYYLPNNTILTIVGDVNVDDAMDLIDKIFNSWSPGKKALYKTQNLYPSENPEEMNFSLADKTQSDIALGYLAPTKEDKDFYSFLVMNHIIGSFGLGGKMGQIIRDEQGLAYYVYSYFPDSFTQPPWLLRAGVNPKNVQKAVESMKTELEKLRSDLVTEDELQKSKEAMIGSLPVSLETNYGMANQLITQEFYNLGMDYLEKYPKIINSVTRDDIRRVAKKYLKPKSYKLVISGPEEK
jgi:zinc protease